MPVAYTHHVGRRRSKTKSVSYKDTVPCCRECNVLLSDRLYFTIPSRAMFLLALYQDRYKKLLKQPDWSDEELEEVGDSMRLTIIQSMRDKAEIKRRLEYLEIVATETEETED